MNKHIKLSVITKCLYIIHKIYHINYASNSRICNFILIVIHYNNKNWYFHYSHFINVSLSIANVMREARM